MWPGNSHPSRARLEPESLRVGPPGPRQTRDPAAHRVTPLVGWLRLAVVLSILLSPQIVPAQEYGRWWWEVTAGLAQRNTENIRESETTSSIGQSELRVSTALNGFIVNPAIASFRVVLDSLLTRVGSDRSVASNRFGLGGEISGLPRGKFPFRLYARNRFFSFDDDQMTDPVILLRQPDRGFDWGGGFQVRGGAFRGIRLSVDQSNTYFEDSAVGTEKRARQSLEWQRGGRRLRHRWRLENNDWNSALSPLGIGGTKILVEESAVLGADWLWETNATGQRRRLTYNGNDPSTTDFIDIRNRCFWRAPDADELELHYDVRRMSVGSARGTTSNQVGASYRWHAANHWQVTTTAQVNHASSGDSSTLAPRLGLGANWQWTGPAVQLTLSPAASYGRPKFDAPGSTYEQSILNLSVLGVVASGETRGLRKEFEVELSRNDLKLVAEPIEELPDLGISTAGVGVLDWIRGRLTLRHHWDGSRFDSSAEWRRIEQSGAPETGGFTSENLTGNLQFTGRSGSVTASIGRAEASNGPGLEQLTAYYTAGAVYRPWRYLQLRAWYGKTRRQVLLAPDIDGVNYSLGLRYRWGRVYLSGEYFDISDRSAGSSQFTSRGFQLTLSSEFSGLLPVRSILERRGVIR